ncbi:hypothetical protein Hdeb2414_s0007g00227261 [Helianthus debilis subsp. tardiflorus]
MATGDDSSSSGLNLEGVDDVEDFVWCTFTCLSEPMESFLSLSSTVRSVSTTSLYVSYTVRSPSTTGVFGRDKIPALIGITGA